MSTPMSVARKLIQAHLVSGEPVAGAEIGLKVDQTPTQDATGTLVMLELEAMDIDRVGSWSGASPSSSATKPGSATTRCGIP